MTTTELQCPRDHTPLVAKNYEADIEVDTCPTCEGTWLDAGELAAIQSTIENDYRGALDNGSAPLTAADIALEETRGPIACPKCGAEMEKREHGMASQIMIDACTKRCGIWLDKGELGALERFYEQNRGNETLPLHWRLWASVASVFKR